MPTGPVLSADGRRLKAQRAGLTRHRGADHPDTIAAERDYRAEVLAEHVREVVDGFPPLTPEQRDKIATLLRASTAYSEPAACRAGTWGISISQTSSVATCSPHCWSSPVSRVAV